MSTVHSGASSAAMNIMPNPQGTDMLRYARLEQSTSAGNRDDTVYAAARFASVPDETSGARLRRASDENPVLAGQGAESSGGPSAAPADTNPFRKIVDAVERFFESVDEGMKAMDPDERQRQLTALTLANAWI